MVSRRARDLYWKYCGSVAYVAVRSASGDSKIGSAFHVGEGVFVTARHVVENMEISRVGLAAPGGYDILGRPIGPALLELAAAPLFHPDANVDVAVFKIKNADHRSAFVPLGSFPTGWMAEGDWVMSDALVFGYPPIPNTIDPYLVVAQAQINALVRIREHGRRHFVLSATTRGGFSGGLALSEEDFALGLITLSLEAKTFVDGEVIQEPGYMAVLSPRSIFECLDAAGLLPKCQEMHWSDFHDVPNALAMHVEPGESVGIPVGSIYLENDANDMYLDIVIHAKNLSTTEILPEDRAQELLTNVARIAREELTVTTGGVPGESGSLTNIRFHLLGRTDTNGKALERARDLALKEFVALGYHVALDEPPDD